MDKKLFEELKEGIQQMADHAARKKLKGVREVTYDNANFPTGKESFHRFVSELDKPARNIPVLRKLLTESGVFDEE